MKLDQHRKPYFLLIIGVVLIWLSQVRFSVELLGWVAPVPFLLFLQIKRGWRSRLILVGALCVGWTLAAAKFITPPFPPALIFVNGISFGIVSSVGFLSWDGLRRGLPSWASSLAFAAIMVTLEWLQYSFTPLASNGAAAYTQLENLAFLQTASLFGIPGISMLMYWVAALVAASMYRKALEPRQMIVALVLVVGFHVWGAFRIGSPTEQETVNVAAVGTDFDWFGEAVPDEDALAEISDELFERSRRAAAAGARLVVWNEVSTIIQPEKEQATISRAALLTKQYKFHLVMSYLVPVEKEPFRVHNKYVWVGPKGQVLDTYRKFKPVPGEPSIPGDGKAKVIQTDIGRLSGAICYDYDFPQLALERAKGGADIVFLPSSDNLGVDPFHTQIAAIRAIEGGYSILRSTRMGLSAGIDPQGRIRGWLSANETNERILITTIPREGVWTLYSKVGDLIAYLAVLGVLVLTGFRVSRRKKE